MNFVMSNYSGKANCSISGNQDGEVLCDYKGWAALACDEMAIPNVDGKDSILPTNGD
jgi:hypothetical protein